MAVFIRKVSDINTELERLATLHAQVSETRAKLVTDLEAANVRLGGFEKQGQEAQAERLEAEEIETRTEGVREALAHLPRDERLRCMEKLDLVLSDSVPEEAPEQSKEIGGEGLEKKEPPARPSGWREKVAEAERSGAQPAKP